MICGVGAGAFEHAARRNAATRPEGAIRFMGDLGALTKSYAIVRGERRIG
jgi:hypothetical protein